MLQNGKAIINKSFGQLSILVPSKKNWFGLIFGTVWMCGWLVGFSSAFGALAFDRAQSDASGFLVLWLLMWTIGGVILTSLLLWGYFGKEKFEVTNREIIFEKTVFGIGRKYKLQYIEVRNFRFEMIHTGWFNGGNRMSQWGLGPGKIKFDYGLKTYSFGLGVDDAEADHIVRLLKEEFNQG